MKKLFSLVLVAVLFLPYGGARADAVVLIHGYLGSPRSWIDSGVVPILERHALPYEGVLLPEWPWFVPSPRPGVRKSNPEHAVYLAQLPSLAPIGLQALLLERQLQQLGHARPGQSLILVGHSVGGVVARVALTRGGLPSVKALITIAAPHLGTPRAEQALDAISDPWPIEVFKEFFIGGPYPLLRDSRDVLQDLTRPVPGSLLFALNRTFHPDIRYISVVRSQSFSLGDSLVPAFSQDMNQVPALAGKSQVVLVAGDHPLFPGDGFALEEMIHALLQAPRGHGKKDANGKGRDVPHDS
ncbi:MAG: alpha/beta hydrolase [Magnetococcales bacterium]|nr:alpha/beta hydrolase [Magnetococcales bacterium]